MNSDDLECFVRVAQYGSISRAALELGSDQSTLSRQIARLEASARTRLFHRSGRGVVLTEAGHILLEHARRVAATLEEARAAVQASGENGPAELVIAAMPTIARTLFGSVGRVLQSTFPRTRLRFVEGLGTHILSWLASGEIDIAVLYLPEHVGALKFDLLLQEDLYLLAPPSFGALPAKWPVARLGEVGLILPSTPYGLRLLALSITEKAGVPLKVALEFDGSTSVTKRLVESGCGYTLMPLASAREEIAQGKLKAAKLVDPEVTRDICIASSRNRAPMPELWEVTRIIREQAARLVQQGQWPGARMPDEKAGSSRLPASSDRG